MTQIPLADHGADEPAHVGPESEGRCGTPNCCGGRARHEPPPSPSSRTGPSRDTTSPPGSSGPPPESGRVDGPPVSATSGAGRFLREFLANPIATAAVAPSSRHLAAAMLRDVDLASLRTIVEFGPGTGVFTRAVLESLRNAGNHDALFLAIEKNPRLAADLRAEFAAPHALEGRRPRVIVIAGDALEVDAVLRQHGCDHADFILSGLGWPSIPAGVRDAILAKTSAALPPGGQFRTFGYHIGLTLPGAWGFRRTVRKLFSTVTVSPVVWRNIPPAFVYSCTK